MAAAPPPVDFAYGASSAGSVSKRPETRRKKKKSAVAPFLMLILALLVICGVAFLAFWINSQSRSAKDTVAVAPKPVPKSKPKEKVEKVEDDQPLPPPRNWNLPRDDGPSTNVDQPPSQTTFEMDGPVKPAGKIDEIVFAKWKELGIEPANKCSDAVFLRRVYLDVIGTLPTVKEARDFLSDKSPDKRKKLVDALLERPEFAEYWAMKWSDLLRVKAEFPINLWPNAAQAYHRWIKTSIKNNLPYDKFVREMLTASGSNFRVPQVNFYRALQSKDPKSIAQTVALTFMGTRADKWPKERLAGMSAFFRQITFKPTGEWKEEIVIYDPNKHLAPKPEVKPAPKKPGEKKPAKPEPPPSPMFPDGTPAQLPPDTDPRVVFADWLTTPQNPWFTRHIVNRIWYWLQGRGIVHEADDIRPDNPPSNPELLNYLAGELVSAKYDLKHIYRLILNSTTYQLSSIPKSKKPEAAVHFASYTVRRLEAEVLIDALNQITGTTESYMSIIPEPYSFIPETRRSISLPDGSITSSFLELFGRPPRDTGMESERNNRVTAGQRLHMLNSSHIRNKLRDGPGMKKLGSSDEIFLAILSRLPSGEDRGGGSDLAWALVNSTEFLFRH